MALPAPQPTRPPDPGSHRPRPRPPEAGPSLLGRCPASQPLRRRRPPPAAPTSANVACALEPKSIRTCPAAGLSDRPDQLIGSRPLGGSPIGSLCPFGLSRSLSCHPWGRTYGSNGIAPRKASTPRSMAPTSTGLGRVSSKKTWFEATADPLTSGARFEGLAHHIADVPGRRCLREAPGRAQLCEGCSDNCSAWSL